MKEFAQFRLDTVNQCLWRHADTGDGERILLTPKAFAVLRHLVEHAGRLVTRDQLLDAVWPGAAVEPGALDNQILNIRTALGDSSKSPAFIETLPRRGYRFIAPVRDSVAGENLGGDSHSGELVGRQTALAQLWESLGHALKRQCQIVFITGELGIGKTALADEFRRQATARAPGLRAALGQCVEGYGSQEPYYPMLEALGQLCRGPEGEAVVRILAAQAPTWLVQFPALIKREHREMLQREIQGATRERMLREIGDALDAITVAAPLLLVFEDLQFVDRSTVDLISAVARRRGCARLMILGTYRMTDLESANHPFKALAEDLLVHSLSREIALGPLTKAEIAEYLTDEAAGVQPPEALVTLLYSRSEGNPLFMVACLEHLSGRGLIALGQGGWRLEEALEKIDLGVPEGLRKMIEAQIDRLSPQEQRVLELASPQSVGRTRFTVASRAAAGGMDPDVFEDVCERLSRRRSIVRPAGFQKLRGGTVSPCYEFVHVLYREVCYQRISPSRRVKLHRQLGEWLEAHWEPLSEATVWLADHFEKGEDWPRAIKYLHLAADTAIRRFAPRQATEILTHALDLVGKLPEAGQTTSEIEILEKLATVYGALGDGVHAIATYETLVARAAHGGLVDTEVRALIHMAWVLSWTGSRRSMEILEQALRLSVRQEDPLVRARTRARCFAKRLWQEWNPQAAKDFRAAFAEILKANDRRKFANYLGDSGFVSWICSEYREAHRSLLDSRAIQFDTVAENPYLSFSYLVGQRFVLPLSLLFLGDWGAAVQEVDTAITLLDRNADHMWARDVRFIRAFVHLHAMDFAGVLAICNSALPLVGDPDLRPATGYPDPYPTEFRMCLILTGSAETSLGNYDSAMERLLAARAEMDRLAVVWDWWWRMPLESALTELWLAKGDLSQAQPQAETFLATALATAERTWQALAWEANARVEMAAKQWDRAEECISKALSTMEGFEVPVGAWRVHATAAELYGRSGDGEHPAAGHHRELSRACILRLANSLAAEDPLRQIFLSAPAISKILAGLKKPRRNKKPRSGADGNRNGAAESPGEATHQRNL